MTYPKVPADYSDLMATARRGGLSSHSSLVYTLHRADCTRAGDGAKPLTDWAIDAETILRKVRHSLNAKACRYCQPDPGPRVPIQPQEATS